MSSDNNVDIQEHDELNGLWKDFMIKLRRSLEEEVNAVASEGAAEWAEVMMREQQQLQMLSTLLQDVTNFKENATFKVESLVDSLTAAVTNVRNRP